MRRVALGRWQWLVARDNRLRRKLGRAASSRRREQFSDTSARRPTAVLAVPIYLTAENARNRDEILLLLDRVSKALGNPRARVKLDFSRVEKIFPGGMLILLAFLELLLDYYPGRIAARCPPGSVAGQLLRHFGVADQLGVANASAIPLQSDVVEWRYLTGKHALGQEVKQLLDEYRAVCDADIPEGLFSVLTEGLTNVRHHAYPPELSHPAELKRWWLFARYVAPVGKVRGHLYVAIYDIGVGIPGTMRNKLKKGEVVLDLLDRSVEHLLASKGNQLDQTLLKAAVEHRRSQTGQPHRGKGLPEMREFIKMTSGARLYIVSGRAQYSFLSDKGDAYTTGLARAFPGTILLWSLPLIPKEVLP